MALWQRAVKGRLAQTSERIEEEEEEEAAQLAGVSCHLGVADVEDAASKIFIVYESRLNETATSLVPPGPALKSI